MAKLGHMLSRLQLLQIGAASAKSELLLALAVSLTEPSSI